MLHLGREQRHHVGAEVGWNHHGGIVLTRLDAIDRFVLIHKGPVKAIVGTQRVDHRVANVHLDGDQIALVALVGIGNSYLEIAGIAIRIPAARNVEPSVESRNHNKTHDHDHADNAMEHIFAVTTEKLQDIFHSASPPFVFESSCLRCAPGKGAVTSRSCSATGSA